MKEVVDKDMDDLHSVMLWIVVNGGKWWEGIGVTEAVTMMPRAEYELYVADAGSPRLTWV